MHRHRNALISYGARFNSTATEAARKRRGVSLHWGSVVIPTREEILRLNIPKTADYSPDLTYLEETPGSVAGRLVQPNLQSKDLSALNEERSAQGVGEEQKAALRRLQRLHMKPLDIAAITQKRVEERLAREAARDAIKAHQFNETIRTVQDNADKLNPLRRLFASPGPLPLAQSATEPPVQLPDDKLSPSALKRREARRLREKNGNQDHGPPRRKRSRKNRSGGMESEADTAEHDEFNSAELEAASPTVHPPQFNGPEPISDTIEGFKNNFAVVQPSAHGRHSIQVSESSSSRLNPNIIDSLVGGDYSGYISLSSTNSSTSSNVLTVVNTAELALSHQRDYIIPQKKRAIEIVKTTVGLNLVQSTKESQATA